MRRSKLIIAMFNNFIKLLMKITADELDKADKMSKANKISEVNKLDYTAEVEDYTVVI